MISALFGRLSVSVLHACFNLLFISVCYFYLFSLFVSQLVPLKSESPEPISKAESPSPPSSKPNEDRPQSSQSSSSSKSSSLSEAKSSEIASTEVTPETAPLTYDLEGSSAPVQEEPVAREEARESPDIKPEGSDDSRQPAYSYNTYTQGRGSTPAVAEPDPVSPYQSEEEPKGRPTSSKPLLEDPPTAPERRSSSSSSSSSSSASESDSDMDEAKEIGGPQSVEAPDEPNQKIKSPSPPPSSSPDEAPRKSPDEPPPGTGESEEAPQSKKGEHSPQKIHWIESFCTRHPTVSPCSHPVVAPLLVPLFKMISL